MCSRSNVTLHGRAKELERISYAASDPICSNGWCCFSLRVDAKLNAKKYIYKKCYIEGKYVRANESATVFFGIEILVWIEGTKFRNNFVRIYT